MKRILTSVLLLSGIAFSASAQRSTKVEAVLISPLAQTATDPFDIPCSDSFDLEFAFINRGPGTVLVTDTLFYFGPSTPTGRINYQVNTTSILPNDTIEYINTKVHRNGLRLVDPSSSNWVFSPFVNGEYYLAIQVAGFTNSATPPANSLTLDTAGADYVAITAVSIDCATAIDDVKLNKTTMTLYPNPAQDRVNFKVNLAAGSAIARVSDIAGRSVLVKDFGKQAAGEKELSIDLSTLTNGMYYVELVNGENRSISKVTIQK